jgi:hypothetical protein
MMHLFHIGMKTGLNRCHGLIFQCASCCSMMNITYLFLNSVFILGMYVRVSNFKSIKHLKQLYSEWLMVGDHVWTPPEK